MGTRLEMTPAQREAVECLDKDCVVSAGAGSGKTRVLVERFLNILSRHPEEPGMMNRIVAITFTEKAATEMKSRIRAGIVERMNNARTQGRLEEAERWYRLASELERAHITTIHAFCARLLRSHPVEAGVDPHFTVLDDVEARMMLQEAVEEALPALLTHGSERLESMVTAWGGRGSIRRILHVYLQMTGNGWQPEELKERTRRHLTLTAERLAKEQQQGQGDLLVAGEALMSLRGGKRVEAFQQAWPDVRDALREAEHPKSLLSPLERLKGLLGGNWGRKPEITRLRDALKERTETLIRVVRGRLLLPEEEQVLEAFLSLLEQVHASYARVKEDRAAVDFDELQTRAVRLLRDHPEVLRRWRSRIRYLMVDEYQDTNETQKQLVDLLCRGPGEEPVPGKRFVVGDPKQSIYRFRGADVSVFGKTREDIRSSGGKEVALTDNFRSDPALVGFVNALFSRLMERDERSPNHYREAKANRPAQGGLRVEWIVLPDRKACPPGRDVRDVEAREVARRIASLIREGTKPGEIAVLFRAMTHVKRYEQELTRVGVPFHVVKGSGFFERQEITDVLHFLRCLADPADRLSWVGVLRSPFCGISDATLLALTRREGWEEDPERWPETDGLPEGEKVKLREFVELWLRTGKRAGRIPVSELIRHLLDESGYRQVLWATPQGKQAQANLNKLVHLSRNRQGASAYSLHAFLQSVDLLLSEQVPETEAPVETEGSDSVKLMTIHQSKGLEFPVVIVPDLSRKAVRGIGDLTVDKDAGLTVRLRTETGESEDLFRWLQVKEKEERLEREESVRLFYVAATRAENRLIFSGIPEEWKGAEKGEDLLSADTWSKWLDGVWGFRRMDTEKGIWPVTDEGPIVRLHGWCDDEGEQETGLDRGWVRDLSSDAPPTAPFIAAAILPMMHPGGWREEDKPGVSVTQLMTLVNCPRKFYYGNLLGLPSLEEEGTEPVRSPAGGMEDAFLSPERRGQMVHRIIEWSSDPEARDRAPGSWFHRVMDEWKIPPSLRERVVTQLRPLVEAYLESRFHRDLRRYAGVKREAAFVAEMDGLAVEGVIDRLHCTPEGEWELVDYKTNDVDAGELEATAREYLPQLQLYMLAAREVWGIEVDRAHLFFLKPNLQVSHRIDAAWREQALETLDRAASLFRSGRTLEDYAPRPGKRCRYCGYRGFCEGAVTESSTNREDMV